MIIIIVYKYLFNLILTRFHRKDVMTSYARTQSLWLGWALSWVLPAVIVCLPRGEVRAQPVAVTCGQTLTADTVMANDLNDCPHDGLILGASDMRLDCASHTLTGSDTRTGIRIASGVGGVEIVNCMVSRFETGLDIAGVGDHSILNNTIVENAIGIITAGGERPNVFANNFLNNAINVQAQDDVPNQWDRSDGQVVAFRSTASNLAPDDTNAENDIFVHDRRSATTTRVSIASDGTQGDGRSTNPALSADGRVLVFSSLATNLAPGDTNAAEDIFMHDRRTGITVRLSLAPDGTQADGNSITPAISGDGRVVAFDSSATNLVAGDINEKSDIFVYDRRSGITTRVSIASDGAEANGRNVAPTLSRDGLVVAFQSFATNLAATDTNGVRDIFVHERLSGATIRVSLASNGAEADGNSFNAALSASGDMVVFQSAATNLVEGDTNGKVDIFVHDRLSGTTTRVSTASDGAEADGSSFNPVLSAAGRFVAFRSSATNLVPDDTNDKADIFVHDRQTGVTTRVSVASDGAQADGNSQAPLAITADGRVVAFQSFADNLAPGDTQGVRDTFVHDRQTGVTTRVSVDSAGGEAKRASFTLAMSAAMHETNIVGGPYLDGNFYANPDGAGFSQTCPDDDRDGFCDTPHILSRGNVDRC